MFSRIWKYLLLALCSTAGMSCSHDRCNSCSSGAKPEPCRSCASSAGKAIVAQPPAVMTVKPLANGGPRTYVMVPSPECSSCKPRAAVPRCDSCNSSKNTVVKTTPVPKESPAANAPAPRPLDQSIAAAKPAPPIVIEPKKPTVAKTPKEFRDPVTGAIRLDHARDYSWLVGQLEYLQTKHQWRVRYSPYDVDDDHGGVVSLSGVDHLTDRFRNGMTVRVLGQLVNPDSRKASPEYFVHDMKMME
jgi:hypothetical protein